MTTSAGIRPLDLSVRINPLLRSSLSVPAVILSAAKDPARLPSASTQQTSLPPKSRPFRSTRKPAVKSPQMPSPTPASTPNPWLSYHPDPAARIRLFCLPHAGAGTSAYNIWKRFLPSFNRSLPHPDPGPRVPPLRTLRHRLRHPHRIAITLQRSPAISTSPTPSSATAWERSLPSTSRKASALAQNSPAPRPPLCLRTQRHPRPHEARHLFTRWTEADFLEALSTRYGGLAAGDPRHPRTPRTLPSHPPRRSHPPRNPSISAAGPARTVQSPPSPEKTMQMSPAKVSKPGATTLLPPLK